MQQTPAAPLATAPGTATGTTTAAPAPVAAEEATEALAQSLVDSLSETVRTTLPAIVDRSQAVATITSPAEYDTATTLLTDIVQPALDEIDRTFDGSIRDAHQLHKRLLATKRQVAQPWEVAKQTLLAAREGWRRRLEAEQRQQREELEAAMRKEAERAAREQAEQLYLEGRDEEADAIVDQLAGGEVRPSVELPETVVRRPKAPGTAVRTLKRFRIVDPSAIKREFLTPDTKAIQRVVDDLGKAAEEVVGGIEFYTRDSEAVRSKR